MSSIEKAIERLAKSKTASTKQPDSAKADGAAKADDSVRQPGIAAHAAERRATKEPPRPSGPVVAETKPNRKIVLDYTALSALGYAVPEETESKQLAEEYRIIKRPVLLNAFGKGAAPIKHGNLVSITSSLASEGKTFTALNLGMSIASEMDATVLLIDGDVIKASLSKLIGADTNRGLIDLLETPGCDVSDVILDTQNPKLKIIPAGTHSAKSTELLASQAMERLLAELAERYRDRIVLFDSPPILATSEASVLNYLMGQVLLVVEAGGTPVQAVKEAVGRLDTDKAVGLILNKSRDSKVQGYLGTYY
ncbi:MAG: XrtA-associated tyrosine autokinase [Chromatiales bacterium]|jgi:exopolysaccharide/PEP-CTERM locus tyrosine autokinase